MRAKKLILSALPLIAMAAGALAHASASSQDARLVIGLFFGPCSRTSKAEKT